MSKNEVEMFQGEFVRVDLKGEHVEVSGVPSGWGRASIWALTTLTVVMFGALSMFGGSIASAQTESVTVTIPATIDPGTLIQTTLGALGTYMPNIIIALVVVAMALAILHFMTRTPRRAMR